MLKVFAEKMWVAFAVSAKNIKMLYIESTKTVNEMTLNELVKLTTLWTTGPDLYQMPRYATFDLDQHFCQCPSPDFTDNPLYTALWRQSDKNSVAINNLYLDFVQTRGLISFVIRQQH